MMTVPRAMPAAGSALIGAATGGMTGGAGFGLGRKIEGSRNVRAASACGRARGGRATVTWSPYRLRWTIA
jgi:hypothetical protein